MLTVTLNPALDVCARIPVVEPDRKMHCTDVMVEPGGGGINVARVAVRLGVVTTAAAFVAPTSAEHFVNVLAAEGVPLEIIPVSGPIRDSLTVVESSTERQYRFILPGPAMEVADFAAGLERISELCAGESSVVISGSSPPGVSAENVAELIAVAKERGAEVIVDTSGDNLTAAVAVGVSLVKPSVNELSTFAGQPLNGHSEIEGAALRLLGGTPTSAALVSLAAAGALLIRPSEPTMWFHAPPVRVSSTVGAGDSLVAGVATALERGETMAEAARFGVAAGTAAALTSGTGLCEAHEVERLLPQVNVTTLTS